MSDIRLLIYHLSGGKVYEFEVYPHALLPNHPKAWRVVRDGVFLGFIYRDANGLYHQTQPVILLGSETIKALAHEIEKHTKAQ